MDSILSKVTAKRYLTVMNLFILVVHTILFFVFLRLQVTLMVCVNACSILCYLVCIALVIKERVRAYILVTYLEIMIHSFLAVLAVGRAPGFQLYFIGSIAVVLFAQYFAVHLGIRPVKGILLSVLGGVMYVLALILDWVTEPLYPLEEPVVFGFTMYNSVLVFMFIILFFGALTYIASDFEVELAKQAMHDNLTGLINRHYLTHYMDDTKKTTNLEHYWLAILDIDDFKLVNDRHGHLCGDYVLKSVADIIRHSCGGRMVCRWGGEEFMILGVDEGQEMDKLLEKVRTAIEGEVFAYNDQVKLHLTATIGAARYRGGESLDDWVNRADRRLYSGKHTGKNKVVVA